MTLEFNGIPVNVIKSCRKTISLRLKPGEIEMRVPSYMSRKEIQSFLIEKRSWIEKHWERMTEQEEQLQGLPKLTEEEIRTLAEKALQVIPERVRHYAPMIGVTYGRITIRNQRTRWGSCSSSGNLNFNCLLMLTPEKVIDSVVVHELCHRKHMDHSQSFYALVGSVFPEYWQCHQWLKENGSLILGRLP